MVWRLTFKIKVKCDGPLKSRPSVGGLLWDRSRVPPSPSILKPKPSEKARRDQMKNNGEVGRLVDEEGLQTMQLCKV